MIPREVFIEMAKLQHEARTLQDAFLTELEDMTKALEAKYAPRLRDINRTMDGYKQRMAEHESLSEEIKWRTMDRENHATPIDVTQLMNKAQLREKKARQKVYIFKGESK